DKDTVIKRIPMMGCDIERIEDDHVDIEFFPNRPDLYSTEGVARAIKGFLDIETGLREFNTSSSGIIITRDSEIKNIRPYLACAVVRGMQFNSRSIESLMALQESLHWAVGRNRKKVSIGVHDMGNLTPPFKYIAQDPDFKFTPLDFTEALSMRDILEKHPKGIKFANLLEKFEKYPLILDANNNVLSFPPIINGELTKVTRGTTDLFIEVTGLDPAVSIALNIVVASLAERGGMIESVLIDGKIETPDISPGIMELKNGEVEELLGFKLTNEEIITSLKKIRYGAQLSGNSIKVSVPAYRSDILHNCDLIEDIAIAYGFDKIKPELPLTSMTGRSHPISRSRDTLNEIMTGLGYLQVMPFTLTNERMQFDMMRREKAKGITQILYPISEDHTIVRPTILPNLLEILSINKHRELPQRIFEAGEVVLDCKTYQRLGCVAIHPQANFTEIQAIIDAVLRERRIEYTVTGSHDPAFIEGRCADVLINGEKAGVFGEIHPEVISNFGLEHPIIGFELEL
ncbi:partial phenylalanyl-tRNA synthetase beta chain, partial [Methanosarcinales archaeon]